jgi:hypothetical protein
MIYRREFGFQRNRPDASLLPPGKVDRKTRWRYGATNKRRNPMNRLIKNKDVLHLLDDAAPSCRPQVGRSIGMVFDKRDGAFC